MPYSCDDNLQKTLVPVCVCVYVCGVACNSVLLGDLLLCATPEEIQYGRHDRRLLGGSASRDRGRTGKLLQRLLVMVGSGLIGTP